MKRLIPPFLIFAAAYAYYALLACPSFYFWDSAELTAAVLVDGVPHPPGFPFLLLLAKLWLTFTPLDDPYALNLFSAAFAALGLSLWYLVIMRVLNSLFPRKGTGAAGFISVICVIVMGVSITYAIQATRFEVYSLNFFMFAAIFYLALILADSGLKSFLTLIMALLIGLALGLHILTVVLILPGIILLAFPRDRVEAAIFGGGAALAFIAAAGLYLTIFLLAQKQPVLNWGDPSNISRFFDYLFVKEFSPSSSSFTLAHLGQNVAFVLNILARQVGALGLIFAAAGLLWALLRDLKLALSIFLILAFNVFSSVFAEEYFYENFDLHGYHLIALSLIALCAAVSLMLFYSFVSRRPETEKIKTDIKALLLTAVVAVLVFVVPVNGNLGSADLSDASGRDYAERFLEDSPDGAIVLTSFYNTYFCLLAYQAAYGSGMPLVQCIYDWNHEWGKAQAIAAVDSDIPLEGGRQTFYRNYLNAVMKSKPVYIEYDDSSGPIAGYLKPRKLGYIFAPGDTLSAFPDPDAEIESILPGVSVSSQVEWISTWGVWFNSRGRFYERLGDPAAARAYFDAMDSVARQMEAE